MYSRYIAYPKELSIVHNRPMTSLQNNRLGTNNRLCTHWEPRILKMDRPMQQDMSPHIAIGSYFASATLRIGNSLKSFLPIRYLGKTCSKHHASAKRLCQTKRYCYLRLHRNPRHMFSDWSKHQCMAGRRGLSGLCEWHPWLEILLVLVYDE